MTLNPLIQDNPSICKDVYDVFSKIWIRKIGVHAVLHIFTLLKDYILRKRSRNWGKPVGLEGLKEWNISSDKLYNLTIPDLDFIF